MYTPQDLFWPLIEKHARLDFKETLERLELLDLLGQVISLNFPMSAVNIDFLFHALVDHKAMQERREPLAQLISLPIQVHLVIY